MLIVYNPTSTVYNLSSQQPKPARRFVGGRISYYPNSDASYQISLLLDGDICPNPGPVAEANRGCRPTPVKESIAYNREQLFNVSRHDTCHQKLSPILWRNLTSLGISCRKRTRRGRRAGVSRRNQNRNFSPLPSTKRDRVEESRPKESSPESVQDSALREVNMVKRQVPVCTLTDPQHELSVPDNLSKFSLWNARLLKPKVPMICDLVIKNKVDIMAITETWLNGDHRDNRPLADLASTLPTHVIHHIPRKDRAGGRGSNPAEEVF